MILSEQLKQHMQPLAANEQSMSAIELDYCQHYGLDIEKYLDDVAHYLGYIDSCNYRITTHLFQQKAQSKGTWFVLHGYYDHTGLITHIIRFFLQQGYDVLVYDLPGHGLSSGKPATIPDFSIYSLILEDVYNYCQPFLKAPFHAFGQSTGSAIITDFLHEKVSNKKHLPFERLILSAPLVRPYLWSINRWRLYIVRPFLRQIPRKFMDNSRDKDFLERAHNDPLTARVLPIQWVSALDRWIRRIEATSIQIPKTPLIIQGTQDTTVDAPHNINKLQKLYNSPNILWLENAQHHLPNELKETRDEYSQWIIKHLGSEKHNFI